MAATKFEHPDDPAAEIYHLADYVPWGWHKMFIGGFWDADSSRILDLKKSKAYALAYYEKEFAGSAGGYNAICAIPSHDPNGSDETGIRLLAARVAMAAGVLDGRPFLRRKVAVTKLADGGSRDRQVHMTSMKAENVEAFAGGRILLLDDVLTSGNSLLAGRRILLDAGAADVVCVALGKTKH